MKKYIPITIYTAFIVYASLFPFTGCLLPGGWLDEWPATTKIDVVVNVVAYVPFGFLVVLLFPPKSGRVLTVGSGVLCGLCLSIIMETLQICIPTRYSSIADVAADVCGAMIGSVMAVNLMRGSRTGDALWRFRDKNIPVGRVYLIGVCAIIGWLLSQHAPFIPTIDPGKLKACLTPLCNPLDTTKPLNWYSVAEYAGNISGMGLIAVAVATKRSKGLLFFLMLAGVALLVKPFVLTRQLSPEAIVGYVAGGCLSIAAAAAPRRYIPFLTLLLIITGYACYELEPGITSRRVVNVFNWVPFGLHIMGNRLVGIQRVLADLWPFVALSFVMQLHFTKRRVIVAAGGGAAVFLLAFILESLQQYLPGRSPDITTALIAVIGWTVPFFCLEQPDRPETEGLQSRDV